MRQWFTMKAEDKAEERIAEIMIYDEIGQSFWNDEAVGAKEFVDNLAALGDVKQINLHINSPGGDVFDGIAIHNALKSHKANVSAHIDGLAASIASYIAMAADEIHMPSNAFMLMHQAAGFGMGNTDDMRALADDLDRVDKAIVSGYAARSKQTPETIRNLMKEDRLMGAAEAKTFGLADEVTKEIKLAAKFSLRLLPKAAAETLLSKTGDVGGPPSTAPAPQGTGAAPPSQPPSPPSAVMTAQLPSVDVEAKIKEGVDNHTKYVAEVFDLCLLAGYPERAGDYVRNITSILAIRKDLIDLKAKDPGEVHGQHAASHQRVADPKVWLPITNALNERNRRYVK